MVATPFDDWSGDYFFSLPAVFAGGGHRKGGQVADLLSQLGRNHLYRSQRLRQALPLQNLLHGAAKQRLAPGKNAADNNPFRIYKIHQNRQPFSQPASTLSIDLLGKDVSPFCRLGKGLGGDVIQPIRRRAEGRSFSLLQLLQSPDPA